VSVGLALGLAVLNPGYVHVYDSLLGQLVLVIVVALYAAGFVWMRRLATFDAPERLLTGPSPAPPGSAPPGSALPGSALPGSALPGSALPGSALPGSALPGSALPGSAGTGGSATAARRGGAS
jgi:hypothetical protein